MSGSRYWIVVSMVFLTTGNIEDKRKLFEFNVPFEQTNVTSLFEKIKRKLQSTA